MGDRGLGEAGAGVRVGERLGPGPGLGGGRGSGGGGGGVGSLATAEAQEDRAKVARTARYHTRVEAGTGENEAGE